MSVSIDQVLVINLDSRPDRWGHFKNQATNSQIINTKYSRVSAIDGKKLDDKQLKKYLADDAFYHVKTNIHTGGLRMSYGGIGLALTYKNILDYCKNNILLLEDDIIIDKKFDLIISQTLSNIPDDWDIIYFGWYDSSELIIQYTNEYVNSLNGKVNGTQAWLVNPKSAKKILDMFPLSYQIDTELYLNSNLIKYSSKIPIVTRAGFNSDIQIR